MKRPASWPSLAAGCIAGCGGGDRPASAARSRPRPRASPPPSRAATGDLNTCAGLVQDEGRSCYSRELAAIVNGAADPLAAVEGITEAAYADQSGFLLANCHGIMHTVAREYALRTGLDARQADGQPARARTTRAARPATPTGSSRRSRRRSRRPARRSRTSCAPTSETRYQRY